MTGETPTRRIDLFPPVVTGLSDGLILPFALVTAFSRLSGEVSTVVAAGLVASLVGSLAMGMGNYFSLQEEAAAEDLNPAPEEGILDKLGLSDAARHAILMEKQKAQSEWSETRPSPAADASDEGNGFASSAIISLSYLAGGFIPVIPYLVIPEMEGARLWSCITAVCLLFTLGLIRGALTGKSAFAGAIRSVCFGIAAAGLGWLIAGSF
ncbi:MAG: hypothetical protein EOP49_11920 [Sphingobacteriales bacterium]|nr:MAG: hypothetical protein EOP49_11920 [Sphingobacteriales bacterium]